MKHLVVFLLICSAFVVCQGQQASSFSNTFKKKISTCPEVSSSDRWRQLPAAQRPCTDDERRLDSIKATLGIKMGIGEELSKMANTTGIDPQIGVDFGANETISGTPPDNSIAISNAGFIVSADNNSLDYFDDIGNSLLRVRLDTLLKDSIFTLAPFDPMIEYDFNTDRFYLVFVHGFASQVSMLALLVSKTNDPRDGWWEYAIPAQDTVNQGIWMDYPCLGHNQESIFVSGLMLRDNTDAFEGNKIVNIELASALNGGILSYQTYYDVKDGNGDIARVIVPASIAQVGTYSKEMYFVSSEGFGGDQVHLYHFHPGINSDTIESFAINTSPYSLPLDANQLGSNQLLRTGDCKVRSAFYLDSKLHFAFAFDIGQGYSGISYNIVEIASKTNTRDTWGLAGVFDYAYPSLASFGVDSTDPSIMICFLRSGSTIYPQVCVVNYDGTWSPTTKIVHNGQGPVDISEGDRERWGDHTGICRRFNGLSPGNWLSGHYGAGPVANQYGVDSCWATWIAEIGDGHSVNQDSESQKDVFSMIAYPNPFSGVVTIQLRDYQHRGHSLEILDLTGKVLFRKKLPHLRGDLQTITIDRFEMKLGAGTYIARILENPRFYEKIVVLD